MKISVATLLLLFSTSFFSQNEKLNQYDSLGKKHGKWILYLDELGDKVRDTTKATCFRYTWYDHGVHIYPMGGFIVKSGKLVSPDGKAPVIGQPTMLNGEYKCYDKNGKLKFVHVFENGNYISYTEFYKSGEKLSFFDYAKHCDDQPWSWYMYTCDKKGNVTYQECISKGLNGKWPPMRG
jgi:hypothetical protein